MLRRRSLKKAQSGIIMTILIILLVLGSFVVLWNVVNLVVRDSSSKVGIESFTTRFEIREVELDIVDVDVTIYRAGGDEVVKELKFVFYSGGNIIYEDFVNKNIPGELESFVYKFFNVGVGVERVLVVPVFEDGSFGMEVVWEGE